MLTLEQAAASTETFYDRKNTVFVCVFGYLPDLLKAIRVLTSNEEGKVGVGAVWGAV